VPENESKNRSLITHLFGRCRRDGYRRCIDHLAHHATSAVCGAHWAQSSESEKKSLLSDGDLKFSDKNKVHLILARVRMTGHRHPKRETHLQQAVGSSRICARQTYGTETHIKVKTF
jgi:hypothetical protein